MGQQQTIPYKEYQKDYTIVSKNQNDQLLIRHKQTAKEYMLRKVIAKSEQELQQRLKILNRRRKIKSEHLLNIIDFKAINDDRICGNSMYVSLLIEYPFESLYYETLHRLSNPQTTHRSSTSRMSPLYFQQHELWSILYSCALGLEALCSSDMMHESITKSMIFIDKEGVVKIGDPILLGARTNYDRVIEMIEKERRVSESSSESQEGKNFYSNDKNQAYLKRLNRIKQPTTEDSNNSPSQTSTLQFYLTEKQIIISPELISLCKDHQYYYFDKQKSDVYVLGAMMVELALLENVASFNSRETKFNQDLRELFAQKSKLKEKYSPAFLSVIEDMLNIDPKKRLKFNQLVQKIQEFSIQENSQSDRNSFKKNPTDYEHHNQSETLLNNFYFTDQTNNKFAQKYSTLTYDKNIYEPNKFQTGHLGLGPLPSLQSYTADIGKPFNFNFNLSQPVNINPTSNFHPFPSFSLPKDPANTQFTKTEISQQSVVRPMFSKKLPVQIKYVQSPLTIPVSNVRGKGQYKNPLNPNASTPFHTLNLTESNDKNQGKEFQKESIVKKKITIVGPSNINGEHFFSKANDQTSHVERFSMNNFGKIQIPNSSLNNISNNFSNAQSNSLSNNQSNSLSNPTSANTSMMPTPRFQNPFNSQSFSKINQMTKPTFPFNNQLPSSQAQFNQSSTNYFTQNSSAFNAFNPIPYQSSFTQQLNSGSKLAPSSSSYDPKKKGFSISDEYGELRKKSAEKEMEPYFSNSSVGYTLPKYRPESTTSEAIKSTSQQKVRCTSANSHVVPPKNSNGVLNLDNSVEQVESFLQREDTSPNKAHQPLQHSNSTSAINTVSHFMNQKNDTYSNSSRNTVKKETSINKNNSGRKKYNFYKKEINQNLEKIDTLQPITTIRMDRPPVDNAQGYSSHLRKQELNSYEQQNSIKQVQYDSQNHSTFVEEQLANGSVYRGFKLNNQRHGNGLLVFADSGFYQGQFHQDQMQGQGKLYYNQHDLAYQGQFFQNCFHGHGVLYNNNPEQLQGKFDFANMGNINNFWIKYDGYFKEDQKSGKCHVYFTNGEQFEGFCQNNTFEGNGRFKTLDGDYVEGVWRNNVLIEILDERKMQQPQM